MSTFQKFGFLDKSNPNIISKVSGFDAVPTSATSLYSNFRLSVSLYSLKLAYI